MVKSPKLRSNAWHNTAGRFPNRAHVVHLVVVVTVVIIFVGVGIVDALEEGGGLLGNLKKAMEKKIGEQTSNIERILEWILSYIKPLTARTMALR